MDYISELRLAIGRNFGCGVGQHVGTYPVREVYQDRTAWEGEVMAFELVGHPQANLCFAWGFPPDNDAQNREIITILALPPATSPEAAVKVAIAAKGRKIP